MLDTNANLACSNNNATIDEEEDPPLAANLNDPNNYCLDVPADGGNVEEYKKLPIRKNREEDTFRGFTICNWQESPELLIAYQVLALYKFHNLNYKNDQDLYAEFCKKNKVKEQWEKDNPDQEYPHFIDNPRDSNPYNKMKYVNHPLTEMDLVELGISWKEHKKHGNVI